MSKQNFIIALVLAATLPQAALSADPTIAFTKPANGATLKNPVEICLEVSGVELQAAKMGVHEGKGHLHILVDTTVADPAVPLATDKPDQIVHMGDATKCRTLKLAKGAHKLEGVFTNGAHVPGAHALTTSIDVTVE